MVFPRESTASLRTPKNFEWKKWYQMLSRTTKISEKLRQVFYKSGLYFVLYYIILNIPKYKNKLPINVHCKIDLLKNEKSWAIVYEVITFCFSWQFSAHQSLKTDEMFAHEFEFEVNAVTRFAPLKVVTSKFLVFSRVMWVFLWQD